MYVVPNPIQRVRLVTIAKPDGIKKSCGTPQNLETQNVELPVRKTSAVSGI